MQIANFFLISRHLIIISLHSIHLHTLLPSNICLYVNINKHIICEGHNHRPQGQFIIIYSSILSKEVVLSNVIYIIKGRCSIFIQKAPLKHPKRGLNFLPVKLLPLVLQCELPVDDDVYLGRPGPDGQPDLLQPGAEGELAAGEAGGHRGHGDLLGLVPAVVQL